MKRKEIYKEVIKEVNNIYQCDVKERSRDLINIVALNVYTEVCYKLIGSDLSSGNFFTEIGLEVGRKRIGMYNAKLRVEAMCFRDKTAKENIDKIYAKISYILLKEKKDNITELIEWHKSELNRLIK